MALVNWSMVLDKLFPARKTLLLLAGLSVAGVAFSACTPIKESHGYTPDQEVVEKVKPGVHDRNSVKRILGAPTSIANFKDESWFYIAKKTERLAFFAEEVTDQQVVAVFFDDKGIVREVKRYTLEDAKAIDPVSRETATRGKEMTVMEQLFSNLGRFTKDK
jgi:outer membrane protein assembly factor BamE (lipoprotein component of BamABCDE complex)